MSVLPTAEVVQPREGSGKDSLPLPDAETARVLLGRVSSGTRVKKGKKRFDRDDVLRFTAEMAVLLNAGLPLDRAIKVQIDSAADGAQKTLLEELRTLKATYTPDVSTISPPAPTPSP